MNITKTIVTKLLAVLFFGLFSLDANAQIGKGLLKKLEKKAESLGGGKSKSKGKNDIVGPFCKEDFQYSNMYGKLPKGLKIYSQEHSDPTGFSGKYYSYFPIRCEYETSWGKNVFFISEFTIKYDPETKTSQVFYFEEDAGLGKFVDAGFRNEVMDMTYGYGEKFMLEVMKKGNIITQAGGGRRAPSSLNTTVNNPNILHSIHIRAVQKVMMNNDCSLKEDGFKEYFVDRFYERRQKGLNNNIFAKDTSVFAQIDSAYIVNLAREEFKNSCKLINEGIAAQVKLPKQGTVDQNWVKELMPQIIAKGKEDGDNWTDKIQYAYFTTTTWLVNYVDKTSKTTPKYRFQNLVVVTKGWAGGSPCKYINVNIKQDYNGTSFGPTYVDGFAGGHVNVDCKEAMKYKK
ncbi:hypothetical protein [Bernardetia sp.]|uniref:hypothetical protein n=1 Tax=Bernardetia sp. TaxID=1937974 RepID=UPI0025BB4917|nr:hypothetical protein [Bernardetia sp.]